MVELERDFSVHSIPNAGIPKPWNKVFMRSTEIQLNCMTDNIVSLHFMTFTYALTPHYIAYIGSCNHLSVSETFIENLYTHHPLFNKSCLLNRVGITEFTVNCYYRSSYFPIFSYWFGFLTEYLKIIKLVYYSTHNF